MGRTWTKSEDPDYNKKDEAPKTDKMAGDRQGQSEGGKVTDPNYKGGEYPSNSGATMLPPPDDNEDKGESS